ncbi:MAG: hypothetical protein ABIJ86_09410, partial [Spirochaetota bacterium]
NMTINDYSGWPYYYYGKLQSLTLGSGTTGAPVPLTIGTGGADKLEILSTEVLTSLEAPGLTTVSGDVLITGLNRSDSLAWLENLSGLENLETVEGYLAISNCPKLASLFGVNGSLTSLTEHLQINNNSLLADLSGLTNLETLGIQASGTMGLYLEANPALTGLSGLENLLSVTGKVSIINCDNVAFTSLAGLSSLGSGVGSVIGGLEITGMEWLNTLDGLTNLAGIISGPVFISGNPWLSSVATLGAVTEITGDLTLQSLPQLVSIALPSLQTVGGTLKISYCDFVPDLNALTALETVSGNIDIIGNADLMDLGDMSTLGLCNLVTVGGYLNLSNNDVLHDITALGSLSVIGSNLEAESKNGYLKLYQNPQLGSLLGLHNITEIRGNLTVDGCGTTAGYELTDLSGLNAVQTINGAVRIQNNNKLTAFPAMPNLATITSTLYLYNNGASSTGITSLGFTSLNQVSSVTIQQNYFNSNQFADNAAVQAAAAGWNGASQSISSNYFIP